MGTVLPVDISEADFLSALADFDFVVQVGVVLGDVLQVDVEVDEVTEWWADQGTESLTCVREEDFVVFEDLVEGERRFWFCFLKKY